MENTETKNKILPAGLLIGAVLLAVVLGGAFYYYRGPCGVSRVEAASRQLGDQLQEFSDAYTIASSTARIGLAGPVSDMQAVQRATEEIEVPACLEAAQVELVQSMDEAVLGFLAFMSQESDTAVARHMSASSDHIDAFNIQLLTVQGCRPFCP